MQNAIEIAEGGLRYLVLLHIMQTRHPQLISIPQLRERRLRCWLQPPVIGVGVVTEALPPLVRRSIHYPRSRVSSFGVMVLVHYR